MRLTLLKWLTVIFALAVGSSLVSMMGSFLGSDGEDLQDLLALQSMLVPLALGVILWQFSAIAFDDRQGLGAFKDHLPGWLLFAVLAANSLVLVAELSFFLVRFHTGDGHPWQAHVPAATAFSSSIAVAFCYVGYRVAGGGHRRDISRDDIDPRRPLR